MSIKTGAMLVIIDILIQRIIFIIPIENMNRQILPGHGLCNTCLSHSPELPMHLVAGVLRVGVGSFLLLVTLGKRARYAALAWLM
jgi:hypothetical protein